MLSKNPKYLNNKLPVIITPYPSSFIPLNNFSSFTVQPYVNTVQLRTKSYCAQKDLCPEMCVSDCSFSRITAGLLVGVPHSLRLAFSLKDEYLSPWSMST